MRGGEPGCVSPRKNLTRRRGDAEDVREVLKNKASRVVKRPGKSHAEARRCRGCSRSFKKQGEPGCETPGKISRGGAEMRYRLSQIARRDNIGKSHAEARRCRGCSRSFKNFFVFFVFFVFKFSSAADTAAIQRVRAVATHSTFSKASAASDQRERF